MRYSYAKVLLVARAQDCFLNDVVVIAPAALFPAR